MAKYANLRNMLAGNTDNAFYVTAAGFFTLLVALCSMSAILGI